jgi:hypothetical protein
LSLADVAAPREKRGVDVRAPLALPGVWRLILIGNITRGGDITADGGITRARERESLALASSVITSGWCRRSHGADCERGVALRRRCVPKAVIFGTSLADAEIATGSMRYETEGIAV